MQLPPITKSLRFRVSGTTTAVVFGVGALALSAVYVSLLVQVRSLTQRIMVGLLTEQGIRVGTGEIRTMESMLQERLLNVVAGVMLVVLVLMFFLSLFVGWVLAGRALAPLDRIVAVANEIEATDLSRRIGRTGTGDELERVGGTFDAMLDRLDSAFQSQRRFLAQTSHDLRTPLAVIRSNLDVAMANPSATVDEWRSSGEVALRASERMSVMIEDLLTAARLDLPGQNLAVLNLADVVRDAGADLRAAAVGRAVDVRVMPDAASMVGDRVSIDRAVGNLVDNALRLSPDGADLTLSSGVIGACSYICVGDRGPGVDPALVRGERRKRGGLGLEIVRLIVSAHDGWIDAGPRAGGGSRVVMWFPSTGEARTDSSPTIDDLPQG